IHVVCGLAIGISVLAACTIGSAWDNAWLAYHVLTAGLALAGLLVLAVGWASGRREPAGTLQGWVVAFGTLALGLTLRGVVEDPAGTRWSALMMLAITLQAAGLASWQRREGWAFLAGLGANLAATFLAWDAFAGVALEQW